MAKRAPRPTDVCPHCGATFPRGRLACPECGSDARTGWKSQEDIDYESVDIPDYWGEDPPAPRGGLSRRMMAVVAVIVVLAFVLAFVLGGF